MLQPILYYPPQPDLWEQSLGWLEREWERGGRVLGQASPRPFDQKLRLDETFFSFFLIPSWGDVMRRPPGERAALLADPALRPKLVAEGMPLLSFFLEKAWIGETTSAENAPPRGRRLADVARENDWTLVGALIEIALRDELHTEFAIRDALHADLPGLAGDLVVFDADTVAPGKEVFVKDLPGGANRYVCDAVGVEAVVVGGETLVERGRYTQARPGRIL